MKKISDAGRVVIGRMIAEGLRLQHRNGAARLVGTDGFFVSRVRPNVVNKLVDDRHLEYVRDDGGDCMHWTVTVEGRKAYEGK